MNDRPTGSEVEMSSEIEFQAHSKLNKGAGVKRFIQRIQLRTKKLLKQKRNFFLVLFASLGFNCNGTQENVLPSLRTLNWTALTLRSESQLNSDLGVKCKTYQDAPVESEFDNTTIGRSFIVILSLNKDIIRLYDVFLQFSQKSSALVIIKVSSRKTPDYLQMSKALGNLVARYLDHREVLKVLGRLQWLASFYEIPLNLSEFRVRSDCGQKTDKCSRWCLQDNACSAPGHGKWWCIPRPFHWHGPKTNLEAC